MIRFSNQGVFTLNRHHRQRDARLSELARAGMTPTRLQAAGADATLVAAMKRITTK